MRKETILVRDPTQGFSNYIHVFVGKVSSHTIQLFYLSLVSNPNCIFTCNYSPLISIYLRFEVKGQIAGYWKIIEPDDL